MALTYDQITAITRKHWMGKFPQLVFDQNLVQKRLHDKGSKPQSGSSIMQSVMYQASKGGAFTPYDTFDVSAEDQVTAAEYNWKYYEVPITISRDEILKNQGPEGVFKLLDTKMKLAAMKMGDLLATDMFRISTDTDGTTFTTKLNSLDYLLNDASDNLGTGTDAGGIEKTTYAWWSGITADGAGASGGVNWADLNTLFFQVADGNIMPNLIVMHNNSFASYMNDQQDQQRYMRQSEMDAGFVTAMLNGKTVVADLHVSDAGTTTEASNRIYMLNTDFIDFVVHRDENMRLEPFAKPIDQAVMVAHVMFAGELTTNDPSRHGVYENFDSLITT